MKECELGASGLPVSCALRACRVLADGKGFALWSEIWQSPMRPIWSTVISLPIGDIVQSREQVRRSPSIHR